MFWTDKILEGCEGPQVINDSKTPSGRVHVGALRGVLIHDAIARALRNAGKPVRYTFGVDDYDPLDELPAGRSEEFQSYLGMPLCNVPPPIGSSLGDMAEHYISEFFDIFDELGVECEKYRMRDVYRSGKFDSAIDRILSSGEIVRDVYRSVSGSERPSDWLPLQVICEKCGRIGTTYVANYSESKVDYECRPSLVGWAKGCGYQGRISPFGGRAKLPWKLEWVAKWATFGITIEGAGKDHTTRGGSRDVAATALRRIFGIRAPLNVPYEFFLVGGAKMSSSKGIGASARDIADLLPSEILRFQMISLLPKRPVNFSVEQDSLIKLFNDYDRLVELADEDSSLCRQAALYAKSGTVESAYRPNFQLLLALSQIPTIDVTAEIAKRKGAALSEVEKEILQQRLRSVGVWLERFAPAEAKFSIQEAVPASATALSHAQRWYLRRVADELERLDVWDEECVQRVLYDAARMVPAAVATAFEGLYKVFLDRDSGPRGSTLLCLLERSFVLARLRALPTNRRALWREVATAVDDAEQQLRSVGDQTATAELVLDIAYDEPTEVLDKHGVIALTLTDAKERRRRLIIDYVSVRVPQPSPPVVNEDAQMFLDEAVEYLKMLPIEVMPPARVEIFEADRSCLSEGECQPGRNPSSNDA